MRLIDADVLLDSIFKSCNTTEATINNAPTIDAVSVVRGEWIAFDEGNPERPYNWICSKCDNGCVDNRTDYCPDCGAKMEDKP
jgi:rubrerythrin